MQRNNPLIIRGKLSLWFSERLHFNHCIWNTNSVLCLARFFEKIRKKRIVHMLRIVHKIWSLSQISCNAMMGSFALFYKWIISYMAISIPLLQCWQNEASRTKYLVHIKKKKMSAEDKIYWDGASVTQRDIFGVILSFRIAQI